MSEEGDKPAEDEKPDDASAKDATESASPSLPKLSKQKKRVFVVALFLIFLVAQELVLRLLFPVPEIANFNRIQYSQMFHDQSEAQAGRGKFLANASYIHASDPDEAEFLHSLNLYGFRDRQWTVEKPEAAKRVMFFGDSFMEGAMASDEYTIPEGFKATAEQEGERYDTMNMGIQAMGLTGYMFLMADAVPVFKPDVVFVVFFENDFFEPVEFNPQLMEGRMEYPEFNSPWKPRLVQLIENVRSDRPIARRWTSAPFSFFGAVPHKSNPFSDPQKAQFYSQYVDPMVSAAMIKGRFNPHIVDEYGYDEEFLRQPINVSSYLLAYKEFLQKHNCELYTAYIPLNHQISDHYVPFAMKFSRAPRGGVKSLQSEEYQVHRRALEIQCDVLEIPFLDLTPVLKNLEDKGNRLYWEYDNHMRGESYLLVGSELFDWYASRRSEKTKE
ncbi:MAG: SGNH/GDSL hydrolase family protein [Limisphaerales bacterium]